MSRIHQARETTTDRKLTRKETAKQIDVTESCLAKWAMAGEGPKFIKLGKSRQSPVRYRQSDIDTWLAKHERTSTSDQGVA